MYRYNFVNVADQYLEIEPSIGFLMPKVTKKIKANILAKEAVKFIDKDLFIETKIIKLADNKFIVWSNTIKSQER